MISIKLKKIEFLKVQDGGQDNGRFVKFYL